jgi:hypothetical protein
MDIGKFKASRMRLSMWMLIPPLLIAGVGLSSYALQLQSTWRLGRTKALSDVLPKLVHTQQQARALLDGFRGMENRSIQSEDALISFIQETARKVNFTVDSLKVERRDSGPGVVMPVLVANVNGSGAIDATYRFLTEVSASQQLLSESSLRITQQPNAFDLKLCKADITFELVLFNVPPKGGI